jgi:hypothetical protein
MSCDISCTTRILSLLFNHFGNQAVILSGRFT